MSGVQGRLKYVVFSIDQVRRSHKKSLSCKYRSEGEKRTMSGRLREKVEEEFRVMAKFLLEAYQTKRPADKIERRKQVEMGAC